MRAYMLLLITVAAFIAESVKHWSVSVRPSVCLSVCRVIVKIHAQKNRKVVRVCVLQQ